MYRETGTLLDEKKIHSYDRIGSRFFNRQKSGKDLNTCRNSDARIKMLRIPTRKKTTSLLCKIPRRNQLETKIPRRNQQENK